MKSLTKSQKASARKIIHTGMEKAAESLSFFMQEKIALKDVDKNNCFDCEPLDIERKGEKNIHFLTTKIIGDLKGICCLIFSENEADHLRSVALPQEILNNPEIMSEMADGIMLEVDNIISASVITQFSNILKVKIHGDVPNLKKLNYDEMIQCLKEEIEEGLLLVSFKTSFSSSNIDFAPEFLWLFENSFVERIKEFDVTI